jgi:hypothetical protein
MTDTATLDPAVQAAADKYQAFWAWQLGLRDGFAPEFSPPPKFVRDRPEVRADYESGIKSGGAAALAGCDQEDLTRLERIERARRFADDTEFVLGAVVASTNVLRDIVDRMEAPRPGSTHRAFLTGGLAFLGAVVVGTGIGIGLAAAITWLLGGPIGG